VLLVVSALLALDALIGWVGARRGWTNPVAWLGPAFAIAGCLLFSGVILPTDGQSSRDTADRYAAMAIAFGGRGRRGRHCRSRARSTLAAETGPVITDFPIWFAEATRHHALALPNESPESILDLARSFDPPARILVVDAGNGAAGPAAISRANPARTASSRSCCPTSPPTPAPSTTSSPSEFAAPDRQLSHLPGLARLPPASPTRARV
jgi:hypothetical protein